MSKKKEKILVLCVDRDDDIGYKCEIKTPIIGREENLEAASKLALEDPEEADANSMFSAIRTYDNLSQEGKDEDYQVVTIAGSKFGGVKADRQIGYQLNEVLSIFPAEGVVLITDGFADETVVPIIQSHVPIVSVGRVVVKHSESIEESWALFSRYIKTLVEDPYYARWTLGVPGFLLIVLGILWFVSTYYPPINKLLVPYAGIVTLIFFGLAALIKGFGIDKMIPSLPYIPNPTNLIRQFATATAFIIIVVDIYQTFAKLLIAFGDPSQWMVILPRVIGYAIEYAADLIVVATCIFLVGIGIYFFLIRDSRVWWIIVGIVASIWMREVAYKTAYILKLPTPPGITESPFIGLLLAVVLGIVTTVIVVIITLMLGKRYESYFKVVGARTSEED